MPLNAREVIKILEQEGFTQLRQSGSHRTFGKDGLRTTVPDHGSVDMKRGTLNSIWQDAGLDELKNVKSMGQAKARLDARSHLPAVAPETPQGRLATSIMEDQNTRGFWSDRNGRVMHFFSEEHKAIVSVSPSGTTLKQFDDLDEARHYFGEKRNIAGRVLGDIPDLKAGGLRGVTDAFKSAHSGRVPRAIRELGEDAGRILGRATKILGVVGGVYIGYEATNLAIKSHEMAEFGMISEDSLAGYDAMLAGFIAQATVDPTLIGGEVAIQAAYDAWANEFDISAEIKAELQPGLLINDLKDLILSANETLKDAAEIMIAKGAPIVKEIIEEVGQRSFENLNQDQQLELVMNRVGKTLDNPNALQDLISENADFINPDQLGKLNHLFDISVPIPSITPELSAPANNGNWYDVLPSLPSLPSLRDIIPRIDFSLPGIKFGALSDGENSNNQLAGNFNEASFDSPVAERAMQQEHGITSLRATVYEGLPTDNSIVADLDPALQNLAEIKGNIETMLERYDVELAKMDADPEAAQRAAQLLDRIGEQANTFNSEVQLLASTAGTDEIQDMLQTYAPGSTGSQDAVLESEVVELADNSASVSQTGAMKI